MNNYSFTFCSTQCCALASGALYLPEHDTLCVSDLHLGKADRIARRSGLLLPPYEVRETLERLETDIQASKPENVICLGDSFDDLQAADDLAEEMRLRLANLQARRKWIWIEGNHDPGPVGLAGIHLTHVTVGNLTFRHVATAATAEISGHYHPKHRIAGRSYRAILYDENRMIMPAYGTYTGGLASDAPVLRSILQGQTIAIIAGRKAIAVPVTKTLKPPRFPGSSC